MSCISEQTGGMTTSSSILYPKLHFSISLHKESGELHISIVEGNKHASTLFLKIVGHLWIAGESQAILCSIPLVMIIYQQVFQKVHTISVIILDCCHIVKRLLLFKHRMQSHVHSFTIFLISRR